MVELSAGVYIWTKALHIISVIAWMAGLFYLPRLFVYHAVAEPGSEMSETFKVMERRLLKAIMMPAMLASVITGGVLLLDLDAAAWKDGWLHVKLALVVGLLAAHMAMARWQRDFADDRNTRPHTFYRVINEVPTVLLIGIVIMATVKPF